MARQILPVTGASMCGYFGKLSWWRRGLMWLALLGKHRGYAVGGYVGSPAQPFVGRVNIAFAMPGRMDSRTQRQIAAQLARPGP